jgi:hypothetical protein
MNPDTPFKLRIANAETLPDTVSVRLIGDCTKQPVGRQWNLQQIDKDVVEEAHAMRSG